MQEPYGEAELSGSAFQLLLDDSEQSVGLMVVRDCD
jgi:hypothetical protein